MTCIVGLKHEGKVYMGADSAADTDDSRFQYAPSKIIERNGLIVGLAGVPRAMQILQHGTKIVKPKAKLDEDAADVYMFTLCNTLMESFAQHGMMQEDGNADFNFLVAFGVHLYLIDGNFQYIRAAEDYLAVGCTEYALGSLYCTIEKEPEERILMALMAEEHHGVGVMGPFVVTHT